MSNYVKALADPSHPHHREAKRLAEEPYAYTVTDGVIRWDSNNAVPPQEFLDLFAHVGVEFDMAASQAARDADMDEFLAAYRRNYRGPSDEERAEARAAMGEGAEMVNVITGHRWRT